MVLLDGIEYVRDAAAKDCAVWFVSTLLKTCISVLPNTNYLQKIEKKAEKFVMAATKFWVPYFPNKFPCKKS